MTTPSEVTDGLFTEVTDTYVLEAVSFYKSELYFTLLERETDRLDDGSHELYWWLTTYKLNDEGHIVDAINDTGCIDNYPEALQNYAWHLDLYYGKTLGEVMPSTNINGKDNNE